MTTVTEQRVRIALLRVQAIEHERPVVLLRLLRELSDLSRDEVQDALMGLHAAGIVRITNGGWLSRPPPVRVEATNAMARAASLHARKE